jgi:hypothetical protein
MEFVLICGIVGIALLIAVRRITRTLREPKPTCCGCDSCTQPEEVKKVCAGLENTADCNNANHHAGTNT